MRRKGRHAGRMTRPAAVALSLVILAACAASADPPPQARDGAVYSISSLGSYLAARHAQQMRDYRQAAQFIDRALAADPDNLDLMRRAFVLRVSEGRVDDAVPLARRIYDLDPNAGLAGLVLMVDDIKEGRFDAAVQRAASLPRDGAQRFAVPLLLAWSEVGRNRPAPALQALDTIGATTGLDALKELHVALIADAANRTDEAASAYGKAAAAANPSWRVVEMAGNFFERQGRADEARRLYARFADENRDPELVEAALQRIARGKVPERLIGSARDGAAEALFDLASLLNARETLDGAVIYARLALALRPQAPLTQLLIAEILDAEHHTAEALAIYGAIDKDSPLAWSAKQRTAIALDELGRTDEAIAQLKAMAAERPQRPEALVELGDILRSHSRFEEAVAAYDQAIARIGTPEPQHWRTFYSRGVALERSGHWTRAEADLKHALALQPDQPMVLNYLGYSWIDKGENLEDALGMVRHAVELRPNDGYMVDSLGWAFYRLGQYPKATEYLERAIELLPEDPTINDHLGDAYWRTGRLAEARYQWRRALQFQPEADQVKMIESKLDRGLGKVPAAATARGG